MAMGADGDAIGLALDEGVAVVTINRPAKRNALSLAMWSRLSELFEGLKQDDRARAVILTGAGGNFCAGADISEFAAVRNDAESGRAYEDVAEAATVAIRDWPGPTIAAISGYAMGGGCSLALACDLRVGDATAKMGIPAARLGILYGALDCELLYRQVGLANGKRVLYSGRPFGADDCARMGLLDVVADGDALTGARDMARVFVENAPLTLGGSKFILHACAANATSARAAEIETLVDAGMASADYAEGRQAFMERREPRFAGR